MELFLKKPNQNSDTRQQCYLLWRTGTSPLSVSISALLPSWKPNLTERLEAIYSSLWTQHTEAEKCNALHCIIFSYSTHIMAYCIQISHFTFQLIKGALQGSIRFQQGPMQLWYLQPRYLTYSPFASNKHRYKASQLFLKSKQGFFSPQHTNIAQQVRTFVTVIFDRWPIFPHQEIKRIT